MGRGGEEGVAVGEEGLKEAGLGVERGGLGVERGGCTWTESVSRAEGEPGVEEDSAPLGLQLDRGIPPLPPAAEEGGEGGVHLRLVGVEHDEVGGVVGRGHDGAEAAPTGPILALLGDLKTASLPFPRWRSEAAGTLRTHSERYLAKGLNTRKALTDDPWYDSILSPSSLP